MAFFTFRQNRSGGHRKSNDLYVIVEAHNAAHANSIAMELGVYFDGVEDGIDCACCGDRWCRTYDDDARDTPQVYRTDARTLKNVRIYYLNGTVERY